MIRTIITKYIIQDFIEKGTLIKVDQPEILKDLFTKHGDHYVAMIIKATSFYV